MTTPARPPTPTTPPPGPATATEPCDDPCFPAALRAPAAAARRTGPGLQLPPLRSAPARPGPGRRAHGDVRDRAQQAAARGRIRRRRRDRWPRLRLQRKLAGGPEGGAAARRRPPARAPVPRSQDPRDLP